jgi:hypothetical protein
VLLVKQHKPFWDVVHDTTTRLGKHC